MCAHAQHCKVHAKNELSMMSSFLYNSAAAVHHQHAALQSVVHAMLCQNGIMLTLTVPSVLAEAVGSAQLPWSKICFNCWPSARVIRCHANQAVYDAFMHVMLCLVISVALQAWLLLLLLCMALPCCTAFQLRQHMMSTCLKTWSESPELPFNETLLTTCIWHQHVTSHPFYKSPVPQSSVACFSVMGVCRWPPLLSRP